MDRDYWIVTLTLDYIEQYALDREVYVIGVFTNEEEAKEMVDRFASIETTTKMDIDMGYYKANKDLVEESYRMPIRGDSEYYYRISMDHYIPGIATVVAFASYYE